MSDRIAAQPAGLQLSNLGLPRTVEVTKPQRGESIAAELSDNNNARFSAAADGAASPASVTGGQAVPSESDRILPSAAAFHDVSIDALHNGLVPLALMGAEGQKGNSVIGADHTVTPHQSFSAPTPTVTIPPAGGPATTVFEAGLGARNGEPAGTHAGQPSFPTTTRTGTISFASPDGVQSVSLGGHALNGTPQTFTDATGSLTASYTFNAATGKGAISYTYALLDNTVGVPNASFAVAVIDRDGDANPPANLVIRIVDDAPVARLDSDALTSGQMSADGNVLTGAGTTGGLNGAGADIPGADGGLTVVGVAAGNGPGGAAPGTVSVAVAGAHGILTLFADGSYSYVHTSGGGNDVFTYTIRDADGSLSHATLTINLGDSAPGNIVIPPPGGADTQVFEAGLPARGSEPAGSDPTKPITTQTGVITFPSRGGWPRLRRRRDLSGRPVKSHH
jgi:Bacterial Ig domain